MNKTTVVGLLLAVFMLVGCCDKTWCIGFAADFFSCDSTTYEEEFRLHDNR